MSHWKLTSCCAVKTFWKPEKHTRFSGETWNSLYLAESGNFLNWNDFLFETHQTWHLHTPLFEHFSFGLYGVSKKIFAALLRLSSSLFLLWTSSPNNFTFPITNLMTSHFSTKISESVCQLQLWHHDIHYGPNNAPQQLLLSPIHTIEKKSKYRIILSTYFTRLNQNLIYIFIWKECEKTDFFPLIWKNFA